jgi:hypothetical protein
VDVRCALATRRCDRVTLDTHHHYNEIDVRDRDYELEHQILKDLEAGRYDDAPEQRAFECDFMNWLRERFDGKRLLAEFAGGWADQAGDVHISQLLADLR